MESILQSLLPCSERIKLRNSQIVRYLFTPVTGWCPPQSQARATPEASSANPRDLAVGEFRPPRTWIPQELGLIRNSASRNRVFFRIDIVSSELGLYSVTPALLPSPFL